MALADPDAKRIPKWLGGKGRESPSLADNLCGAYLGPDANTAQVH